MNKDSKRALKAPSCPASLQAFRKAVAVIMNSAIVVTMNTPYKGRFL